MQTQSAEDWCCQNGTLQTKMPNEATDGLAPSILDSFSTAVRAAFYEFPPASEEEPMRYTAGSYSHHAPEARPGAPARGHYKPKEPRTGVPRGGSCRPKCPTRLPTGWHSRFLAIFRAQLERIFTFFRQRAKRTRGKKTAGLDSRRAHEACVPARRHYRPKVLRLGVLGRGHFRPKIPTHLLTLFSNTLREKWCSGSPHTIFTLVPFVVCRGRRVILLRSI